MFLLRIATVLTLCLACVGCEPKPIPPADDSTAVQKERPPLRVWIVDAPELEKELLTRWRASSDQALAIENVSSKDLFDGRAFAFDTILFPGNFLGDMVERDIVSKLPSQVTMQGTSESSSKSTQPGSREESSNESQEDVSKNWPDRFRSSASYAGKLYAVPLGSNSIAMVSKGVDVASLTELQNNMAMPQGTTAKSLELWESWLRSIESGSVVTKSEDMLSSKIEKAGELEKQRLVDQFLWIASTTDKQRRGLFDLAKMQSRLKEPEFIYSVRVLARLARLFPEAVFSSAEDAWAGAGAGLKDSRFIALGWPAAVPRQSGSQSDSPSEADVNVQVVPILWNPNRGLVASVGKGTRQTSVSIQFLRWLSLPEQREALRSVCSRIELLADQPDRNIVREDYQKYSVALSRSALQDGVPWSLRLVHSLDYREALADALLRAIRTPDQADKIMAECSQKWNELTESFGKDKQLSSEERSQGFQK